jgi:small subunit ribosomal protein S3
MGQKVHPYGFRLGGIRKSKSRWFAEGQQYRQYLIEDMRIRQLIEQRLQDASISDIIMERAAGTLTITIQTAKPGIVIGRAGQDVDRLRRELDDICSMKVRVNVEETSDPDINAQLIAEGIARQIERRVSYRRAMRQAVERAMRMGAGGVRCMVSGRLGGAEIARTESTAPEGRVPLHTLRADVQYGFSEARTTYGHIGCKVWVFHGEILPEPKQRPEEPPQPLEDVLTDAEAETERVEPTVEAEAVTAGEETSVPELVAPQAEAADESTATADESAAAVPDETGADEVVARPESIEAGEDPLIAALTDDEVAAEPDENEESSDADS